MAWVWAGLVAVVVLRALLPGRRIADAALLPDAARVRVPVLLVRPCAGAEPQLLRRLVSTAEARTRHALEVVLCVATPEDPARPMIEAAAQALVAQGLRAHARVAPTALPNHKCGQLARVIAEAPAAAVILSADADVDLTGVDLDRLIDPILAASGPAATFAPPVEVQRGGTLGDRASQGVLDASLHAFALLTRLDPQGFVGKLFAVETRALTAAGGFEALAHYLGEDLELARRLRAQGRHTRAVALIAEARVEGRGFSAVIARYGRWLSVIRAQRPALLATYPLLFFPTLPLVALAVLGQAPGALALALVARVSVAMAARRASERPLLRGLPSAIVLGELVLILAFARAVARPTVTWRGRTLRLVGGGRIAAADAATKVDAAPPARAQR